MAEQTLSFQEGVNLLAQRAGADFGPETWKAFKRPLSEFDQEFMASTQLIVVNLMRGLLVLGSTGYAFVPVSRIKDEFGKSLRENYPEANDIFLGVATTYWTFKIWIDHVASDMSGYPLAEHLVRSTEFQIGSLFFPMPGPAKISPEKREAAQRELLKSLEVPIDIDGFIAGNPILTRERSAATGCMIALAFLGAVASLSAAFLT